MRTEASSVPFLVAAIIDCRLLPRPEIKTPRREEEEDMVGNRAIGQLGSLVIGPITLPNYQIT